MPRGPILAGDVDHRVLLRGVSFEQYEGLLASRGESASPRMIFLEGDLEIMSPSRSHESIKKLWSRLLEAYAEERGIELVGTGAWTLRSETRDRGLEPDESYFVGLSAGRIVPDLALEVVWTSGLLDKMEVYRGLGIREVWVWRDGRIETNVLRNGAYERTSKSELLPEVEHGEIAILLGREDQTAAVREYRLSLRR